jgi:hypothetical protein
MGIDAHATSRGTDPDEEYPPHVLAGLSADGVEPVEKSPLLLSAADLESATEIIAFCSPHILPEDAVVTEMWDDVPPVSESYERARDEIVSRVRRLLS